MRRALTSAGPQDSGPALREVEGRGQARSDESRAVSTAEHSEDQREVLRGDADPQCRAQRCEGDARGEARSDQVHAPGQRELERVADQVIETVSAHPVGQERARNRCGSRQWGPRRAERAGSARRRARRRARPGRRRALDRIAAASRRPRSGVAFTRSRSSKALRRTRSIVGRAARWDDADRRRPRRAGRRSRDHVERRRRSWGTWWPRTGLEPAGDWRSAIKRGVLERPAIAVRDAEREAPLWRERSRSSRLAAGRACR